jgi:hypothetical protein
MACPKPWRPRHGAIAAQAAYLLASHLAAHPRCRVVVEAGIRPDDYNVRIPDLAVTASHSTTMRRCCASRS